MINSINSVQYQNINNKKSNSKVAFKGLNIKQFNMLNRLKTNYQQVNWNLVNEKLSVEFLQLFEKSLKKLNSVKSKIAKGEFDLINSKGFIKITYIKNHWLTGKERLKVETLNDKVISIEQTAIFKRLSEIGPKRKKTFVFDKDGQTPRFFNDNNGMAIFKKK